MPRTSNWKKTYEETKGPWRGFTYRHTSLKGISVEARYYSPSMIIDGLGRDGSEGWVVYGLKDKGERNEVFFQQIMKTKAEAKRVSLMVMDRFNSSQQINSAIRDMKKENKPRKYTAKDFKVISGRSTDLRMKYLVLSHDNKVHANFFDHQPIMRHRLRGTYHSPKDREFFNADAPIDATESELIRLTVREVNKLIK